LRHPNQDSLRKIDVVEGTDYSVNVDLNFSGRMAIPSSSIFKNAVMRLFGAADDTFSVTADEARVYSLLQPKTVFKVLCDDNEVKKWLQDGYQDKQDSYLVIGYRTLLNAVLISRNHPSSTTQRNRNFETTGERIYSICYRKVRYRFIQSSVEPALHSGNRWKSYFKIRGAKEEEYCEVDLEDEDTDGGNLGTSITSEAEMFLELPAEEPDTSEEEDETD